MWESYMLFYSELMVLVQMKGEEVDVLADV
jgi:hypothetical protein